MIGQAAEKGPSAALARSRGAATYGLSTPPTHLRWVPRASRAALHLDLFEQPAGSGFFSSLLGRQVAQVVTGRQEAGFHQARWDAEGLPSGVYLCRLQAGDAVASRKLLLMK